MLKKFRFKTSTLLLLIPLLVSLVLNVYFYRNQKEQNRVVEVVDGDTFQLLSGKRVRLMGVDAPEADRCGGKEAKEELTKLLQNKIVNLKEEITESYGRALTLVYVNNTLVNKVILEKGWARTDYRKNSQREVLTAAFHKAQKDKIGIWSDLCRSSETADDCKIKGNIDKATYEKFYHLPDCLHYDEVIIEKDIGENYFCTEDEALAAGFRKAQSCP